MKLFALLTCDSVNIDEATGKHFIFGHFSSVKVKSFPAVHPSLILFVGLTDIPAGGHSVELRFGLPSDTPAPPKKKKTFWDPQSPPPPDPMKTILEQPMTSTGADQRLYLITEMKDLPLDKEGTYQIALLVDKTEVGRIGLGVGK